MGATETTQDFSFKLKSTPKLCSIETEEGVPLYDFSCPDDTDNTEEGQKMCARCDAIAAEVVRRWNLVGAMEANRQDANCKLFRAKQCPMERQFKEGTTDVNRVQPQE